MIWKMKLPAPPTASVKKGVTWATSRSTTAARSGMTKIDGCRASDGIARTYIAKTTGGWRRIRLQTCPPERVPARAIRIDGNLLDDLADRVAHALVVAVEDFDDFVMGDGRHTFEPYVEV